MDLEALGNVGEMVGGLAVVVSLVYLSIQLRQNTISVRSSTYQAIVAAAAATNATIYQSKELSRLLRLGCEDTTKLDEEERVQFSFLCSQFIDIFENLYLHHRHGTLEDDFWIPRSRAYLDLFKMPGFAHCWSERKIHYSVAFRDFVERELADLEKSEVSQRLFLGASSE